jgi:S1-C subfamily serine protease
VTSGLFRVAMVLLLLTASVAAAAQTKQPQPSLKDTLEWMQNTLDENGNEYINQEVRSVRLASFTECQVHFSYTVTRDERETYRMDESFNLADIDPGYVIFHQFPKHHIREGFGIFGAGVQNDAKKLNTHSTSVGDFTSDGILFDMDADYGVRFTKAFKHAVNLCGGKSSISAFDQQPARQAKQQAPSQSAQAQIPALPPGYGTSVPYQAPIQAAAKARETPSRKDIPTIAKAANGAIVTIVMSDNDKPIASGTGFLVSPDGVIVTNYHVIANGNTAAVKFPDGTVLPVDGVLAADKVRDLAVIKIHGKTFRTLTLGNSDQIQIGEDVVAIGNPLGLELTVSNGILSGIRVEEDAGGKFLQTTAPISHGSSGGPLFNMFGEVVGINSLYLEGGENLNFAIPVNDAKRLLLNQSVSLSNLPNEPEEAPPSKSSVRTEQVKKSVLWMNRFLSEHSQSGEKYEIQSVNAPLQAAFRKVTHNDLASQEGCIVSIHRTGNGVELMTIFSFADLDPAKVEVVYLGSPMFQFITLYQTKQILILADGQFVVPKYNLMLDSADAAEEFARMFKQAVALCGDSSEQP